MPKRSERHPSHCEKNHGGGCISGLMNIFEFRHSRLNRKLISDTEPVNRQNTGFKVLGSSSERLTLQNYTKKKEKNHKNLEDTKTTDFVKTSVKKLMEDDMVNEQLPNKPIHLSKGSPEEFNSNRRNDRKDSRRRSRASRSSIDMDLCDEDILKFVDPKYLSQQANNDKTSEAPNLQTLIEELSKIHSRSTECTSDYLDTDIHMHLDHAVVVIPDELSAAIKVIISERHLEEDDKTRHSREFMDALEMINSNKQALLELLQDSNSQFLKQMEGSERASLKNDQKSNSLRGTTISNKTPTMLEPRKHRKFFRRRTKSLDSYALEGEETCHSATKIVILKPGLAGSRFHDNESSKGSFSNLHSIQDKVQGDRHTSYFFFTEIKRKLQHAMGKEHHGVPSFRSSEHRNKGDTDKGAGGDNLGWRSPNRNHFYTEIFSKPSPGLRRDNIGKSKDAEPETTDNTSGYPNQGVSNIYIEAKKHLSEMLNTKEDNPDSVQRQSPKSLGGILSLSTYKDLSSWSHEDLEESFKTARTRLSSIGPSQGVNHSQLNDQDEGDGNMSLSEKSIDNQIDMTGKNIHEKGPSCDQNSRATCELKNMNTIEETTVSMDDVITSKSSFETDDNTQTAMQENDKTLNEIDILVNTYQDKENVENDNAAIRNEDLSSKCSDSDSIEDDQQSPSLIEIPLSPTVKTKLEDTENVSDRTDRQSPISVLQPLFSDDDISPPRAKDRQVEGEIRPQKLHFGEEIYSVGGAGISTMSVIEDGESPFDYVEAVLLGSDLNWDDFLLRWLSSDQILDPSVFQEVELFSSRHNDQKLLFDCTNEVLKEVCDCYFGWFVSASFNRQSIRPAPKGMNLINEIWDSVEWYLLQHLPSKSLDQLVESDMKRSRIWMDLRSDTEHIGIEIESAILEKLLEDTVGWFLDDNSLAEPHETEISIDS
ncbi:hypothetical protein LIER_20011 [Lithospermum erythrorhizon]|uniref:DUF4378 domain-containing protein n=1 Tax=Lithospermum erythrorhizon TaxID=34254 RepID=A0AAV3QMK9_LITER